MVQAQTAFDWVGIAGADAEAREHASRDARALARVLALQDLVQDRDGAVLELPQRVRDLAQDVWPNSADPLADFGLHSSPASFLIARVAVGLVPIGRTSRRHEPLIPEGITHHLKELGVDDITASLLVRGWEGVREGEVGDPVRLSPSVLAGLAERTLTPAERRKALVQVAWSPRCLERLAATLTLSASVRRLMAVLPPESLGPELAVGATGLALRQPERVASLLGRSPSTLGALTFAELAFGQAALARGQRTELSAQAEAYLRLPEVEDTDPSLRTEIVEGEADGPDTTVQGQALPPNLVRPVRWGPGRVSASPDVVSRWQAAFEALGGTEAPGAFLGLRPTAAASTVRPVGIPPDTTVLLSQFGQGNEGGEEGESSRTEGSVEVVEAAPFPLTGRADEALYPAVRGALRVIAEAAEGRVPEPAIAENAGDLDWVIHRARALGLLVQGSLKEAVEAGGGLTSEAAPELRWASDLLLRYGDRAPNPVAPEEARPAAAELVADLAHQLSRTLAGTVPKDV